MARGNPYALAFNGTNSQVNIASNAALNFTQASKFSIEMWFKANSIGSNMTLFNKQRATTNEFVISVDVQADGYILYAIGKQNVAPVNARSKNPIISGKWYHIAAISDGTNISLYLDGVIQESVLISVTGTTQSLANALIGHWYFNATSYFNGQIDEFRIWNTNRSVDDVNKNKNSYLKGTESNLILLYRMNEGSGLTTIDSSPSNISGTLVNVTWTKGMVDMFGNSEKFLITSEDGVIHSVTGWNPKDSLISPLTANISSDGEARSSSNYDLTYDAWKAFDGVTTGNQNGWATPIGTTNGWLEFYFFRPQIVTLYSMVSRNPVSHIFEMPKDWTFEGSNDGFIWEILDTQKNISWALGVSKAFSFNNYKSFNRYRINISANGGSFTQNYLCIGEVTMGGLKRYN